MRDQRANSGVQTPAHDEQALQARFHDMQRQAEAEAEDAALMDEPDNPDPLAPARGVIQVGVLSLTLFVGMAIGYVLGRWVAPHLLELH